MRLASLFMIASRHYKAAMRIEATLARSEHSS